MDPNNILTTAAEITIALAGFSGVAAALSSRRANEWPESARMLFVSLLLTSANTLAFAFFPLLLFSAGLSTVTVWITASAIHALYQSGMVAYRMKRISASLWTDSESPGSYLPALMPFAIIGLQAANALFIQAAWPYLSSIVLSLLFTFLIFAYLLRQIGYGK